MAVDTADKRNSAIGMGLPWRNQYPIPDGSIASGDRQHIGWVYRGIAAGAIIASLRSCIFGAIRGYANTR